MKLLVVCQHYRPEPYQLSDICEALVARGHDVTVVTGMPNYPMGTLYPGYEDGKSRDEKINGVHVHRCALIPRQQNIVFRFLNYYSFMASSCRYIDTLPDDFDAVYCHQSSPVMMAEAGLRYAKKHHKPSVLYCMDLWPDSLSAGGIQPGNPIYQYYLGVSRRIYAKADRIMLSSKDFAVYFDHVLGLGEKPLIYQPQYADALYETIPPKLPNASSFHVMFAGNVGTAQSVETIVEAARILSDHPEIIFHIVGDGIALDRNRELARGLENIIFHGRHPAEEMPAFYAMADAMLVTLRDELPFSYTMPGKVQAYMAAGKPIIGAVSGETARVVEEAKCGVCTLADDAQALAQSILTLSLQPEKRLRYGANGRAYYNTYFSKQAYVEHLEAALLSPVPREYSPTAYESAVR